VVAALFAYQSYCARQRIRQQEIDLAIVETLVAARSGDFEESESGIQKLMRLDALPGWVEMLQGQLALHRNETGQALGHLQRAVECLPESVAASAMLAVAYWQNGQWEEFEKRLPQLEALNCVTAEDYLFKGYAEAASDPSLGLTSIDRAIEKKDSTIARAIRAEVRSWLAQDKTDPAVMELALKDAQWVKDALPGKRIGPLVSLYANLIAANVYAHQGRRQDREKARKAAAEDAQSLLAFPETGWTVSIRYRYLECIQDEDKDAAFQAMGAARGKVESPWPATYYALGLYRRDKCDDALQVLKGLGPKDIGAFQETMRMYLLADLGRHQEAIRVYQGACERYQGTTLLFQHALLCLLGRKKEAVEAYEYFRQRPDTEKLLGLRGDSYRQVLEYNCGLITADQLLAAVNNSKYHDCNAHFFIAMSLLADGNRAGARERFEACVATGCFDFDASDWSRTFLARMNQDPNWPLWIPP
jgi:hypothetical protein